jgi:hypothetical protein
MKGFAMALVVPKERKHLSAEALFRLVRSGFDTILDHGMTCVPCDTRMREILDLLSPALLRPLFKSVFRQFQRGKALERMAFLEDYYLEDYYVVALDGTGYFSSKTMHCALCLHKVHRNGSRTYDLIKVNPRQSRGTPKV